MNKIIIGGDNYLNRKCACYYYADYPGMSSPENPIPFVNELKNDFGRKCSFQIEQCENILRDLLVTDFSELVNQYGSLTVVGVPRSKKESSYNYNQMGLKRAIRAAIKGNANLEDGMDYIVRHSDTCTTHLDRCGCGGVGRKPYPGITKDTCYLSSAIAGKDILLVDDIYTPTCGIDEDVISALYDVGARSVVFYAVGHTARRKSFKLPVGWEL